jgi:hypothetical protein
VRFLDGHEEEHPLAALPDLVTERGNPGNRRRIDGVTAYLAAPVLEGGVELVDTPRSMLISPGTFPVGGRLTCARRRSRRPAGSGCEAQESRPCAGRSVAATGW